jgi:hypothetical protein
MRQQAKGERPTADRSAPKAEKGDHYGLARQHVVEAEARIARQREIVADLQAAGRDALLAEELLALMLQTLAIARAHLQVIEIELLRDDEDDR